MWAQSSKKYLPKQFSLEPLPCHIVFFFKALKKRILALINHVLHSSIFRISTDPQALGVIFRTPVISMVVTDRGVDYPEGLARHYDEFRFFTRQ